MKFLKSVQVSFYLYCCCLANVNAAEQTMQARDVLAKMSQAMAKLNYQGTLSIYRNGKLDALKFYHAVEKGVEQERLLSLNSPLREIIRNSKQVNCIFLDSKEIIVDHRSTRRSFLMDLPENLDQVEKYYQLGLESEETIALQPTIVISIKPLDSYRFARKIWVARSNYLPLKYELLDDTGMMLEQMQFTDIAVMDTIAIKELPEVPEANVRHINDMEPIDIQRATFALQKIPQGFKAMFFAHRNMSDEEQLVEHLLLSDGFASVSIYLEKSLQQMKLGHQSAGAVNSFFQELDGHQLTIMGEVPTRTLRYIAEGFQFKKASLTPALQ